VRRLEEDVRRLEEVRRLRAAGVATKNRRERRPRGGEE
jgi:hypothetical protein